MSNFLAHIKYYLVLAVLAIISGLLVALKLKDEEMHRLQVANMRERFKADRDEATKRVEEAKKRYRGEK